MLRLTFVLVVFWPAISNAYIGKPAQANLTRHDAAKFKTLLEGLTAKTRQGHATHREYVSKSGAFELRCLTRDMANGEQSTCQIRLNPGFSEDSDVVTYKARGRLSTHYIVKFFDPQMTAEIDRNIGHKTFISQERVQSGPERLSKYGPRFFVDCERIPPTNYAKSCIMTIEPN